MTEYWMVRLGYGGSNAEELIRTGHLGVDYDIDFDVSPHLGNGADQFRETMIDLWLERSPGKNKISAGQSVNMLWLACEGIQEGDVVITRTADRSFVSGTVVGGYEYFPGQILQHRRRVEWHPATFTQDEMSPDLARAVRRPPTVFPLSGWATELALLTDSAAVRTPVAPAVLAPAPPATVQAAVAAVAAETVEDELAFRIENQLEDFLVHNWRSTPLGREYDIYEDGDVTGQQYPADGNERMDILAVSKDRKRLLVVELKRGRASDVVVGQVQRYMGYVKDVLLEPEQSVEGLIIAREDDTRIRRALSVTQGIRFMKYKVEFHLVAPESS